MRKKGISFPAPKLTVMAFLIAMAVVLKRVASVRLAFGGVEAIRLGFGGLPIVTAGILFGPWTGLTVGALEDLVGYFVNPMGPYVPHFTLTSAMLGFIPGLLVRRKSSELPGTLEIALAIGAAEAVVSLFMTPQFLRMLFGIPLAVTVPPRVAGAVVTVPLYTMFLRILLRRLYACGVLERVKGAVGTR